MACIQQRGERKYKITVCNGYKPNGQKRMQARTITVPKEVAKRGIQQYVMAEAERLEKRFRTGIDQSENTRFEDYANRWLERMAKRYKVSTLEGYRRMLEAVYPAIGGLPLCKIRPMVLEELCEELRQRPGRNGQSLSENTVHKYLDTISAVLQDAVKNDILLYNPAAYPAGVGNAEVAAMHFAGTTALPGVLSAGPIHRSAPRGAVRPAVAGFARRKPTVDPTFPQHSGGQGCHRERHQESPHSRGGDSPTGV